MCTAIVFGDNNRYFGRNLDYEVSFGERVVVTPRNYELSFRYLANMTRHAAMIGMAAVVDGYPLYYDATNEHGLSIAALNFVGNCHFSSVALDMRDNVCVFELIPYVLGKCTSVDEAKRIFERINLLGEPFSSDLPAAQLHWMIADSKECCVIEITRCGVNVFCNSVGVLTNNPPFPFHLTNLNLYRSLTSGNAEVGFGDNVAYYPFSRGMGAFGLPGDWSSTSRFVRAAFVRCSATYSRDKDGQDGRDGQDGLDENAVRLFHVLDSVAMVKGCVRVGEAYEYTMYSSCCDTQRGIYYFKTYGEPFVRFARLGDYELCSDKLISLELGSCKRL